MAPVETMAGNNDAPKTKIHETTVGVACWMTCSVGMLVFNKLAITAFPFECSLVALQMAATVLAVIIFGWRTLHIGSARDVMRWCVDVPFFTGMLLTSILALKHAPMSLVITFRALSPLVTLGIEQFYPHPLGISFKMLAAIGAMLCGCGLYTSGLEASASSGIFWVAANNFFAIGDRLLQRLMLAKDQCPVDISKTGVMLINNSLGMIVLLVVVFFTHEYEGAPGAIASLDHWAAGFVIASCIVGVAISYTGIWVLSLISATSFLVLVNANKFVIIFLEAYVMHTKTLTPLQILGASVTILGGVGYGKAREVLEAHTAEENKALLAKNDGSKSV